MLEKVLKFTAANGREVWVTVSVSEDADGVVMAKMSADKLDGKIKSTHVGGRPTGR